MKIPVLIVNQKHIYSTDTAPFDQFPSLHDSMTKGN